MQAKDDRSYILRVSVLNLTICFACITLPHVSAQSNDEAKLRSATEAFFAAYRKKDLDGLMKLWSEKSPDHAASKESFQKGFAESEKPELKNAAIGKVKVESEKAVVRVVIETSGAKADDSSGENKKENRTLRYVKEGEEWKVWAYLSSEEELAEMLVMAKTEEERKALLEEEKELVTGELLRILIERGDRFTNERNFPEAIVTYQLSLFLAEQQKNKVKAAEILFYIGFVFHVQRDYPQAMKYYEKSLKLTPETDNGKVILRVLGNIGNIYYNRGDYKQALEYYEESLKLARKVENNIQIMTSLNYIGTVYLFQGKYNQAFECYQESLNLAQNLDKNHVPRVLNNIGIFYDFQGNYIRAFEFFSKSMKVAQELGDKTSVSIALSNLGSLHELQGNYQQALEYNLKSLEVAQYLGDRSLIASSEGNIGDIYMRWGKYTQALERYRKSLQIRQDTDEKMWIAENLSRIADIYHLQGHYEQAIEYHRKSLSLTEEIGDKYLFVCTLYKIASVYESQGNYIKSLEYAERAVLIAQEGFPEQFWNARTLAGKAYHALNKPDLARQAFAESISTIEKLRTQVAGGEQEQQRFFENKISPYHCMVDLLVSQNHLDEALGFAERTKSRTLLDALYNGRINITKTMTVDEQKKEQAFNAQLVSLNTQLLREKLREQPDQARLKELDAQLQKARLDYEAFQIALYASHPQLQTHRGQVEPFSLDRAIKLIPDDKTALLEFVVTDSRTYLFVLTKNHDSNTRRQMSDLKVYSMNIEREELAVRVEQFRRRLANLDFEFQDSAGRFHALLLGPARDQLTGKSNLIIVPDGPLWELPFQALLSAPARFLIQDFSISYAPSLTVLAEMMKSREKKSVGAKASRSLLAFGNPAVSKETDKLVKSIFMDERLGSLPEAERQVRLLGQMYGPGHSKIYVGAEAREGRAKAEAGDYSVLHLAAHGILNDRNPMYSQIVMSQVEGSDEEDGLLEAWEIMKMDLKADLVVLSACETARGRVGAGEGMIGLTWAMFVAGAPTTVVSQWKVESGSTTELMVEFHRNLKAGKSKAESLREAMLKLMKSKDYRHPFYWAGFVMVGDAR